ncbi:histidinol dehydrogenase [Leptolyngbya cf. ectocarpi LEGE 11479]|uniref:Histidinol dehydrogenase n=1 Tax=Leptolyngbya cf. ectocarpi LEGE 11479 TaxID=1828722 RepID=A0A929FBA2_LEPEC|nr:histidinol dehydrogenase [Leptolyngbya ectocarpi]MBE9068528.1 histidinol dehydrogenase [Leptolyngbya cf. ectocarpi LEGE 11479]
MLRTLYQLSEAQAELQRICDRIHTDQVSEQEATVQEILNAVRLSGDEALLHYTAKFDQQDLTPSTLRISGAEIDTAYQQVSGDLLNAIRLACKNVKAFHQQRLPKNWVTFEENGVVLGKRYTPVAHAGIYVPGGRAAYPSTVVMNAIPAQVAGVERLVMVTPTPKGYINPAVLVAAQEAGVQEIYRIGGAQAIGALAYGTQTIPKVDIISGPGNIYVTLAKKQVYGTVGIDSLAGPSEVLIIADHTANPVHVAADLLAQAEHDPMAAAILITTDSILAEKVVAEVEHQLAGHPRQTLTEKAIAHYGIAIVVDSLAVATQLSNQFAPEHLELEVEDPWSLLEQITQAGAIFLGHDTPEAVGDYLAGPNHTLPTSGAARYASPLSTETFMKHSSLIQYSKSALSSVAGAIDALTNAEGLPSHGDSVRLRVDED